MKTNIKRTIPTKSFTNTRLVVQDPVSAGPYCSEEVWPVIHEEKRTFRVFDCTPIFSAQLRNRLKCEAASS